MPWTHNGGRGRWEDALAEGKHERQAQAGGVLVAREHLLRPADPAAEEPTPASHRIASQPLLSGVNIGKDEDELG